MKRHNSKLSWIIYLAVWLTATAANSIAQESVKDTSSQENGSEALEKRLSELEGKLLEDLPARKYKVERGAAQKVKLFKADPKLLENKFVASALLIGPRDASLKEGTRSPTVQSELQVMEVLPGTAPRILDRGGSSLFTGIGIRQIRLLAKKSHSEHFQLLIPLCPKEQLPSKDILDFLTGNECDRDVTWEVGGAEGCVDWFVQVYAPTEEAAEQRLAAIIQILDGGLCRPLQRECLAEGRKSLEAAFKGHVELAKQVEVIRVEEAKAAKPTEITPELLRELKAQKVMTTIELAAIDARVKACNELLKELGDRARRSSPNQFDTVSEIKVKAEIDLAGIKEKLNRINAFITEADESYALQSRIRAMRTAQERLGSQIPRDEQRAERYARLVSLYAPLELKDNQITVSPIEWTN